MKVINYSPEVLAKEIEENFKKYVEANKPIDEHNKPILLFSKILSFAVLAGNLMHMLLIFKSVFDGTDSPPFWIPFIFLIVIVCNSKVTKLLLKKRVPFEDFLTNANKFYMASFMSKLTHVELDNSGENITQGNVKGDVVFSFEEINNRPVKINIPFKHEFRSDIPEIVIDVNEETVYFPKTVED